MTDNLQERQKHVVSFQCDSSTTARLAELARRGDRTLSAEIRRALREHVANEDPRSPPLHVDVPEGAAGGVAPSAAHRRDRA
jgi:predicted transcriptional regulator